MVKECQLNVVCTALNPFKREKNNSAILYQVTDGEMLFECIVIL